MNCINYIKYYAKCKDKITTGAYKIQSKIIDILIYMGYNIFIIYYFSMRSAFGKEIFMYIINYPHNSTKISKPDNPKKNLLHVSEIGFNIPSAGYTPEKTDGNCFVLHYLVSGNATYYGQVIEAPCIFLLVPGQDDLYQIDSSPQAPQCKQYWIAVSGEGAKELLDGAGVSQFPYTAPCSYINRAVDIFENLQNPESYLNSDDHFYMMSGFYQLLSLHCVFQRDLSKKSKHTDIVIKICNYIQDNYSTISNEAQIAHAVFLSTNHMHRIFKKEMGITPINYLNAYRIRCAKKLLKDSDISLNKIAETLGFSSANYFCTVFKKYCNGVSPSDYRKKLQWHMFL